MPSLASKKNFLVKSGVKCRAVVSLSCGLAKVLKPNCAPQEQKFVLRSSAMDHQIKHHVQYNFVSYVSPRFSSVGYAEIRVTKKYTEKKKPTTLISVQNLRYYDSCLNLPLVSW